MNKGPLTFEDAVQAYFDQFEYQRAMPAQHSSHLSELRGTTWFLRNMQSPLARVNHLGEVRMRETEE